MKLDTKAIRYLTKEDWRVLAAVEQGSKNHEVVPTPLIQQIAKLRGGSAIHKCISNLAKVGLIAKVKNARYDGYRLTYGGLDYLALNAHRRSEAIFSLGNQIGVGKESDIYVTADSLGSQRVLKIHRLGRISFRTVKSNRDYLRNRSTGSWMYLSRLAAQKEHAFMCVLHREGFPVPQPFAWSRHTVVMEFIDAFPLRMIESVPDPGRLYAELMDMIVRLAQRGLIHGDFNEFNILIQELDQPSGKIELKPILIDFPQIVSTNHVNAQMYFDRDVGCIKRYFERRFKYVSDEAGPHFQDALKDLDLERRLDVEVEASGFSKKMAKDLERHVEVVGGDGEELNEVDDADEDAKDSDDDCGNDYDHEARSLSQSPETADLEESEMTDQLETLAVEDKPTKPLSIGNLGLVPLDIPHQADTTAEEVHIKKKAAGWAI